MSPAGDVEHVCIVRYVDERGVPRSLGDASHCSLFRLRYLLAARSRHIQASSRSILRQPCNAPADHHKRSCSYAVSKQRENLWTSLHPLCYVSDVG